MNVELPTEGRHILAVSGGVDSVALLHMLHKKPDLELIVAHFDHGIRPDSDDDRRFVQALAKVYSLPFVYEEGGLGSNASEAEARQARYEFLRRVTKAQKAKAIITAHHQDDVLETAIINLLRGTGRKGLTALQSRSDVVRPLLNVSKQELIDYAKRNNLEWREDVTNVDERYLRNYVRRQIVSRLDRRARAELVAIISDLSKTNKELDSLLAKYHKSKDAALNKKEFVMLSHDLALEVMASWLRSQDIRNFESRTLERLVVAAKVASSGKTFPIVGDAQLEIGSDKLAVRRA